MPEDEIVTVWREEGLEEIMVSAQDALTIMKEFPEAGEQLSREMKRGTRTLFAQRRALIAIRTEWRTAHAELIEVTRALQAIGTMGKTVVFMWQAFSIAQMRVADAARDLDAAQAMVAVNQDRLNTLTQRGVTSGENYENTLARLADAKNRASKAGADLAAVQQQNIFGYAGMAMQVAGLVGNVIDLAYHMSIIKALHAATGVSIGAETASRWGLVTALWAQVKAQVAALATMGPAGWAVLAGAATVGIGALAWWMSQKTMHEGGVVPETSWYLLKKGETVLRSGARGGTVIYFSPTIYGDAGMRKEVYDEFIERLRRRGAI